jgi:hypothetical protein
MRLGGSGIVMLLLWNIAVPPTYHARQALQSPRRIARGLLTATAQPSHRQYGTERTLQSTQPREHEVMDAFWELGRSTTAEIQRHLAHSDISVVSRTNGCLVEKRFVVKEETSRRCDGYFYGCSLIVMVYPQSLTVLYGRGR